MEKLLRGSLKIAPKNNQSFDFKGVEIIVDPNFTLETKLALFGEYIQTLYSGLDTSDNSDILANYISAENGLILGAIDLQTNLDISYNKDNPENNLLLNDILGSGLWDKIQEVLPFDELRWELFHLIDILKFKMSLDKSVGSVLDNLSSKILDILSKIPDLNITELKDAFNQFSAKLGELNDTVPGILKNTPARRTKKPKMD